MNFDIKNPCNNCPFRKKGAIELRPGRIEGIVAGLRSDDYQNFPCHKTVHSRRGGEFDDETGQYHPSGKESACIGSVAYMAREGHMSALARVAMRLGMLEQEDIGRTTQFIIDPL